MFNPFSLEGKTIIVTGASSGIGRQCAIDCSKMGAKVVMIARNPERLEETARDGVNLSFTLSVCVSFCANPDKCEIVDSYGYYATIYQASKMFMLMEQRENDELLTAWFTDRKKLDEYINHEIQTRRKAILK